MTMDQSRMQRALVLAGGGVSGVAWEIGVLTALDRAGIDIANADLIVGTSAGSVVGTLVAGETPFDKAFASQLVPAEQSSERNVDFDPTQFQQMILSLWQQFGQDARAIRAGIGKQAQAARTISAEERRAIIASRLPFPEWPHRNLLINAVDAESGEWVVFNSGSGVNLVDAVAASCAVPLIWPVVTINGRSYMDGGMRSGTNADLARGYNKVLVLNPLLGMDNLPPVLGSNLNVEKALLEKEGSQVMVIGASEAAVKAMGLNVLDPANRANSANAGLEQGQSLVEAVRGFWSSES
ncbi:MAG TPA: patatin-like phospholipase family protein [Chloroflexia bacterium]|nr:patatin-like phospholipase family protein [Chloroflexia bacterium]